MADASPGGKQVGKVSIKVVPDASGFRKDLEKQLEGKENVKDVEVPFTAKVDEDQLVKDAKAAAKRAGKAASGETLTYKTEAVGLDKVEEQLKSINANKALKVKFDNLIEFQKVGLAPGEVQTIKAKLAWDNLPLEQAKLKAALGNESIEVAPYLPPLSTLKARFRLFLTELQGVARNTPVRIDVDVDRNALARASVAIARTGSVIKRSLTATASTAAATVGSAFKVLAEGPGLIAKGFAALGPQAIALTALVAALLPPVLALGTGLITLAPSMLALAVPIGAVMLGLDGIKKAAETAKPAFDELKAAVSDTFSSAETGMVKGFEIIRDRLIPAIKLPLQGVAESISGAFNGVVESAASPAGLNNIQRIIDNVSVGIQNATGGLKGFTDGILQLVASISEKFPGIGTWFTELGDKFSKNVTEWTTIPQDNGMTKLENLITNVRTGIEGLTGVFQSFWNQGLKDISDPNFGQGMKDFFSSVKTFVTETLPVLSEGFKQIADLLKQMEPAFKLLGLLSNVGGIFTNPGETIKNATERFKAGEDWKAGVEDALFGVGPAGPFSQLPEQAAQAGVDARDALDEGLKGDGGLFGAAAGGTGGLAGPVQQAVGEVTTASAGVGARIQADMAGVSETVTSQWAGIKAAVDTGVAGIQQSISTLFTTMPAGFQGAFTGIQQTVTGAFGLIVLSIGTQSQQITTTVQQAFSGIPAVVGTAMQGAVTATAGAGAQLVTALQGSLSQLPGVVQQAFTPMTQTVTEAMNALVQAVAAGGAQVVAEVQTWPGKISSVLSSLAATASASGAAVGREFAAGIASQSGAVAGAAEGLVAAARKFFPSSPAKEGPFSGKGWVTYSGKAVGQGFADGLNDSSGGVVSTTRELMQAVKDIFGDAEGLTLNFNLGAAAMGSMAEDAQKFNSSMSSAASSLGTVKSKSGSTSLGEAAKIDTQSQAELDNLKWEQERLTVMQDMLNLQTRGASEAQKNEIKRQTDLLGLQKDRLAMQGKELEYWSKYEDKSRDYADAWSAVGDKAQGALTDFGKSVGQQAMSDLGIGGQGAVSNLITEGSKYVFNVMDMTSAMSAQKTFEQRESLTYTQR